MKTNKKKKIRNIVFIVLTILVNAFIIFEASLPGGPSSLHSKLFSNVISHALNDTVEVKQDVVELKDLQLVNNVNASNSIIIGTTGHLDVKFTPENVSDKVVSYKASPEGIVNLVPDGDKVWVEALGNVNDEVVITATSNNLSSSYTYKLINRVMPNEFDLKIDDKDIVKTDSLNEVNLKVGQSKKLDFTLKVKDEIRQDYLIRYFDPLLLDITSSNDSIVSVYKGYIKANNIGEAIITINKGKDSELPFKVIVSPSDSEIVLIDPDIDISLANDLYVHDNDYINNKEITTGSKLKIDYKGHKMPSDTNFVIENLSPITLSILNDTLYGNKTTGVAKFKVTSISNPDVFKIIETEVKEVFATGMELVINGKQDLMIGESFSLYAKFQPINTTNRVLIGTSSDDGIAKITASGTRLVVSAIKDGNAKLNIKSASNNDLSDDIEVYFIKKTLINDSNETEFHGFIRKFLGHFLLFMVSGVITSLCFIFIFDKNDNWYKLGKANSLSILLGFSLAWLTEFIQIFTPNRGPLIKDVWLDFFGFMTGLVIVSVIFMIINMVKNKHKGGENEKD